MLAKLIKEEALRSFPKEACGFVVESEPWIVPCANRSSAPNETFLVSAEDHIETARRFKITGIYHSHPKDAAVFTLADKAVSERNRLPAYLYSVPEDKLVIYLPNGYIAPLENRPFVLGVHDCVGLVHDYYRTRLGIELNDIERDVNLVLKGFPGLMDYARENSLYLVDRPYRDNDIIAMAIDRAPMCNHFGVLEGLNMWHQLRNKRSAQTIYGGYWERATRHVFRHRKFL